MNCEGPSGQGPVHVPGLQIGNDCDPYHIGHRNTAQKLANKSSNLISDRVSLTTTLLLRWECGGSTGARTPGSPEIYSYLDYPKDMSKTSELFLAIKK